MTTSDLNIPAKETAQGAALDGYLRTAAASGFSGTVLVERQDGLVVHNAYGTIDEEQKVPAAIDTLYDTGSIVKMFTAAAILKLEDEGRLSVSDPISRFFDAVPEDKAEITLHHLLTHTSGIELYSGDDYEKISRDDLVRRVLEMDLQWPPGTKYRYSNPAYSLLGAILELVTGEPYEQHVHKHFFKPAGMQQTGYVIPTWDRAKVAGGRDEDASWTTPLEQASLPDGPGWNLRANGGMLSTAADLYRWHTAMHEGKLLSEQAKKRMFTAYHPAPTTPPKGSSTGYGVYLSQNARGMNLISRGGTGMFGHSDYRYYPDQNLVLILTTSSDYYTVEPIKDQLIELMISPTSPAK